MLRWLYDRVFKRPKEHPPVFTGNCMVRQYTGDNYPVGPCWHSTYNGVCPTHGDVSVYLDDLARWPTDYQLAGRERW